jgi:hypothetical protein
LSATRLYWPVALALILISLAPLLVVDVPGVLDYPNHLARLFVLAHPDDPVLSRFYGPHWAILPNLGFDVLGVALLKFLPVHVGGRILLALSLVAPVLGALAYARAAFGKLSLWSLGAIVMAFNGIFFLGFMNFLLAVGLAFAAAGLWLSLRRAGRDGWCLILGALSSALLFFCHLFGVLLFALLIGCQELAPGAHPPRRARVFLMIAAALTPALLLYFASPLSGQIAAVGGWDGKHKIWGLFIPFMTTSKLMTLVTAFAAFSLVILHWREVRFAPGVKLVMILLGLTYVAAPVTLKGGTLIDIRISLMMGLLLFAGMDPQFSPVWKKAVFAAIILLVGSRSLIIGLAWNDHRRDLADLRATMARIPARARILAVLAENPRTDASNPARNLPDVLRLDEHLPALAVIERKVFWPHMFADPAQQPLMIRPPFDRIADPTGEVPAWGALIGAMNSKALPRRLAHWRDNFDYVLLIDRPESMKAPANFIPVRMGTYTALWRLNH